MGWRIADDHGSLRQALIEKLENRLRSGYERQGHHEILAGLRSGATVQVHHNDIPREWRPARFTWALYELRGETLVGVPTWKPGQPRPVEWTI